jgi:predicted amidophosphoribosyltransferase
MGKTKGCGNEACEAHKKKITYKETDGFCSKCGDPLVYVCKDCYTQLPDDTEKYCVRCLAAHEDKTDKARKVAAGGVLAVGGVMLKFGKNVLDVVKMVKG